MLNTTTNTVKQESINFNKLPKTTLHNTFGVCFDKKETYTFQVINSNNNLLGEKLTINKLLKNTVSDEVFNNNEVIILYKYFVPYYNEFNFEYFSINEEKKIERYSECRKSDINTNLKKACSVAVLIADKNSLKLPVKDKYWKMCSQFNQDSTMYNRVKLIVKKYEYNEETRESKKVPVPESEVRTWSTYVSIDVQFVHSGQKLYLHKTIGGLKENTWGEMLDKSGYNRNAKLVDMHFKLQDYKAEKVRKEVQQGSIAKVQSQIQHNLNVYKEEVSKLLNTLNLESISIVDKHYDKLLDMVRNYNYITKKIAEIGTNTEYTPYTISVKSDLLKLSERVQKAIEEIKSI